MRRPNRDTTVFSTSAIDLFASALGAFILLVMILFVGGTLWIMYHLNYRTMV